MFSAFSYASARFQYAAARQPKAPTRVKKMRKKTMLVRREQMRKMKQMSPVYADPLALALSFSHLFSRVETRVVLGGGRGNIETHP